MTAATPHGLARGSWEPKADVLELVDRHIHVLDEEQAGPEDVRLLAKELTGVLRDVLRVATSRGHLLEVSEPHCF